MEEIWKNYPLDSDEHDHYFEFDSHDQLVLEPTVEGKLELTALLAEIKDALKDDPHEGPGHRVFKFLELANATDNFSEDNLLGRGGFGNVYRGELENKVVATKRMREDAVYLDRREFAVEVLMLKSLHHPNLVKLIGFCIEGNERILVYQFMSLGSLEHHLHDLKPDTKPLAWKTRMNIALGVAKALEYLHEKNPPVIHRDLKCSNVLLEEGYIPKLSDFGSAKLGAPGDKINFNDKVVGTPGYFAPEYYEKGELTTKADVYSYGVVLLEIITGKKTMDESLPESEEEDRSRLVEWALPLIKMSCFSWIADPVLQHPEGSLSQVLGLAARCVEEEANSRPLMKEVVTILGVLSQPDSDTS